MIGPTPQPGPEPGFFGKLPVRGDLVGRRLDGAFRNSFDEWLQRSIAVSQRQLGTAWLPAYLRSPIWRFVLGPRLCGEVPSLGVMIPSVDRVGRYFPLVLAAQLPGCTSPGTLFHSARVWFDEAEQLILTALDDGFDLDRFDREVKALGLPPYARENGEAPVQAVRLDLHDGGDLSATYAHILDRVLMGNDVQFSLWWTTGSEKVRPSVLLGAGMPAPANFSALLDGNWDEWGWERPSADATMDDLPLMMLKPVVTVPCAGRTHPGARRKVNEDAMLIRPDLGVWAVADGVGGHHLAQFASQTVVERLEQLLPPLSFRTTIDDVTGLLGDAHTALRERAGLIGESAVVASTVVALLIYAGHFCALWSGDSRLYRLRSGALELLTRDHATSHGGMVIHAIGVGEEAPFVETKHGPVEPGDTFLLCSDGITKILDEAELQRALGGTNPATMVETLMQDTLIGGAQDNITAVVVRYPRA